MFVLSEGMLCGIPNGRLSRASTILMLSYGVGAAGSLCILDEALITPSVVASGVIEHGDRRDV